MRGGLLWGICVLTFLLCSGIKCRRVLRSGYLFTNIGPLNKVAFLSNPVSSAAKFKRNIEINQDANQQTLTYTDIDDDRSAAVAVANAASSNNAAPNPYLPMSYFNNGNTNAQAMANAQATGNSQSTANAQATGNAQATANAQTSGSYFGSGFVPTKVYRGYGGLGGYGVQQSPYNYPASSSSSALAQAQANTQALSNTRGNQFVNTPSFLNTPDSSSSSALAQALANDNRLQNNLYGNPYFRTGVEVNKESLSEDVRSVNSQAAANAQALSNTENSYLDPSSTFSSSIANALANTDSEQQDIYSKSAEDENVSETERSAQAQAIATAQASTNTGNSQPAVNPSFMNYPGSSLSSALAQALANTMSNKQQSFGNPYYRSGETEDQNISDAERSAYAEAIANAQALSNTGSAYPGLRPLNYPTSSSSSANAKANANSEGDGNFNTNPYFKSAKDESEEESEERSAHAKAIANAHALSNVGRDKTRIYNPPLVYNPSSPIKSAAMAQAIAKARLRGQNIQRYPYGRSGDEKIDDLSEVERSLHDQATKNVQVTDSSERIEKVQGQQVHRSSDYSPSSRVSPVVSQSHLNVNPENPSYLKSTEVDDENKSNDERSAHAQAIANAKATGNAGMSGFGARPSPYSNPSSSISSALAQALANSNTRESLYGNLYSKSGISEEEQKSKHQRSVDAQDELSEKHEAEPKFSASELLQESEDTLVNSKSVNVDSSVESRNEDSNPLTNVQTLERYGEEQEAGGDESSDVDERRAGGLFAYTPSTPGYVSRVLSDNEIFDPNAISGQNIVQCSRPNELHAVWLLSDSCLICTCVQQFWGLKPICASCNSCLAPPKPPAPTPPPLPPIPDIVVPIPPVPPPLPVPQVSCDPLPTETPFENPLNPCQICICKQTFNVFGQPDVQIQCEENPKCLIPDIIPMPLPEPPSPSPITVCENFPLDVPFPNPFDECLICQCVMEPYTSVANLVCVRNTQCDLIPEPLPQPPIPVPPLPLPIPDPEPFPIISPSITDMEPMPWPPIVPRPKPRSPLPGPPPHETCSPYPPNTPFQHPWDECQTCECSEIYGPNVVNIEVNCYTKPSCCNELPGPEPLPGPTPDQVCQFQSLNVDFPSPTDACKICNCQLFGTMILPVCRPSNDVGCNVSPGPLPYGNVVYIEPKCQYREPYQTFIVDCNLCYCQEVFQYVIAKCTLQPNCVLGTPGVSPLQLGSETNAFASANANANSQFQNYLSPLNSYNQIGNQFSSAIAEAQAQSTANSYLSGLPLISNGNVDAYNNVSPFSVGDSLSNALAQASASDILGGNLYGNYPLSPGVSGLSNAQTQAGATANAQAQAEAISNAQFGGLYNGYPYTGGSPSSAQADATANAQTSYGVSPYSVGDSLSNALAQASASDVLGSNLYSNYPLSPGVNGLSNAQAQAEAIANAQTLGVSPYGINPYSAGGSLNSAQAQADAISTSQGGGLFNNNPYLIGGNVLSNSQAQAEAIANAQALGVAPYGISPYSTGGGLTSAQAQADAIANTQSLGILPYDSYPYNIGDSASALAQSQANSLYGNQSPLNTYPYSLLGGSQSNAQAQAGAIAQSNAIAASQMYPNLYPLSSPNVNPLFGVPQGQSYSEALANAQAQATGSASAQSLAQAAAQSGRPLIRSGRGLCQYDGDKYHQNCQACFCFRDILGELYTLCLGNPCQ